MNVVQLQPKRRTNEPTYLPEGFMLNDMLRAWAKSRAITRLDERFEHFTDICLAKGYKYLSWEAAFRNACRQDWAKLGPPSQVIQVQCSKCHKPLINGHTNTSQGKLCNECYANR